MTIKKSSQWKRLSALAVVPVIALALLAFANPGTTTKSIAPQANDSQSKIYSSVEQMPQFPGGEAALMKYLMTHIQYPVNAAKNNVQGRVIVQFVVEKTGEIGEVKVARSVDEELDAEAVRVVKELPKFTPGRQKGEPVRVWYTLPISFKLQSDKQEQKNP